MVGRNSTSTTSGSQLAQPQIDQTAYVHSFSNIVGDVKVGANVLIAPGTSIRADKGGSFHIGAASNVQDGAVIHGLEQGRVVGADQKQYSVWIGSNTSITHMALIHGPAYVGDHCFIGFRSTVFNARVGDGCIVMMHALIQDVAIPPGRYVPSGAVITTQQQADRLPDVKQADRDFVVQVVGLNDALRSGYHSAENVSRIAPIRQQLERTYHGGSNQVSDSDSSRPSSHTSSLMQNTRLAPETVDYVRQLLSQGLKVGAEHADRRRFQTSSWYSCGSIQSNREGEVLNTIENWASEYSDEYVRVYGIDPRAKRRVSEVIINRPDGSGMRTAPTQHISTTAPNPSHSYSSSSPKRSSNYSGGGNSALSSEIVERVHQFINQGFKIGTEHADSRRFQTSSWQSCSPIQTQRPAEALAALEGCLAEHAGEYVRFFGIDPRLKQRVAEMIIQRPGDKSNGKPSGNNGYSNPPAHNPPHYNSYAASGNGGYSSYPSNYSSSSSSSGGRLSSDVVNQVRQLLSQGYRISAEHADPRRFQTSSWKTCAPIQSNRDSDVLAALESCMAENSGEYVRLVGVDTRTKRRVAETIVQRP